MTKTPIVKVAQSGFEVIELEPARVYRVEDASQFLADAGIEYAEVLAKMDAS